jgi:protein gp37
MTKIEWTNAPGFKGETWNVSVGCRPVSSGCLNCYAARMAGTRLKHRPEYLGLTVERGGRQVFNGTVRCLEDRIDAPLHWREPRMVFVDSMSDLFYGDDEDRKACEAQGIPFTPVDFEFVDRVFAVMALCPRHVFQILTKRPARMAEYLVEDQELRVDDITGAMHEIRLDPSRSRQRHQLTAAMNNGWMDRGSIHKRALPLPNLWLLTSAENQATLDERLPHLLRCPAAVRGLSLEPLLGEIDIGRSVAIARHRELDVMLGRDARWGLDWVIAGGESGSQARPMHPDWARSLRDQCAIAGVPFFFKQWGEWAPHKYGEAVTKPCGSWVDGEWAPYVLTGSGTAMVRVGKKAAGAVLDGREYRMWPGHRTNGSAHSHPSAASASSPRAPRTPVSA